MTPLLATENSCWNATTVHYADTVSLHHHAGTASCCFLLIDLPSLPAGNSCCNAATVHCTTTLSPYVGLLPIPSVAIPSTTTAFPPLTAAMRQCQTASPCWCCPSWQSILINPDAIPQGAATACHCTAMSYPALPYMCSLMLLLLHVSVTCPSPGVLFFSFIIVVFY